MTAPGKVAASLVWIALRAVSGIRHWTVRRFTSAGLLVTAALVASAMLGIDTNRRVAYQVFTFLLFLVVVAIGWSVTFRSRFDVERLLPPYGSVGEPFTYRVRVRNLGPRPLAGLALLEDVVDPRPTLREYREPHGPRDGRRLDLGYGRWSRLVATARRAVVAEQPIGVLPPGGTADVRIESVPLRRGHLGWTGTTIARPDPFGLFKAFVRVRRFQSVPVLPRRYPLAGVALPGTRKYQHGGVALAASVGDSEEFVGLRDYRAGDPVRRIHWRSWARLGKPVVKEYQEEFFVRHALVLDTFTALPDGVVAVRGEARRGAETSGEMVFEEAVSVAASFACTVETRESLLDLMFVGPEAYCVTAGRGLAHVGRLLEILAAVDACRDRPFDDLRRLVVERAGTLSGAICVLLAWDEARRRFVDDLGVLGVPTLVVVVTAPGARLDAPPRHGAFHQLEVGKIAEGLARL